MKYVDPDGRETYDSAITKEQYDKSFFLQMQMSWVQVQEYFINNPNTILHRPEDQFLFMKLKSRKEIGDINDGSMIMIDILLIGRGIGKTIYTGFSTLGKKELSQSLKKHILSRHSLKGLRSQYGKAPLQKLLNKTIFNPKWSDKKILKASRQVIRQALNKGITNGTYSTIIYGEHITVSFRNGIPQTVYGAVIVTEEMLK